MNNKVLLIAVVISLVILVSIIMLFFSSSRTEYHSSSDPQIIQTYEGTKVANEFFSLLSEPSLQYEKIRPLMSKLLRYAMPLEELESLRDQIGFTYFKEAKWTQANDSMESKQAGVWFPDPDLFRLNGEIIGKTGVSFPTSLILQKENGSWVVDEVVIDYYSSENASDTELREALDLANEFMGLLISDHIEEALNLTSSDFKEALKASFLGPSSNISERWDYVTDYENYTKLTWTDYIVFAIRKLDWSLTQKQVMFIGTINDATDRTQPIHIWIPLDQGGTLQISSFNIGTESSPPELFGKEKRLILDIPENPAPKVPEVINNPITDKAAESGDVVSVDYIGKFDNGTIFDTSYEREPLQFTLGGGYLIPGFEEAIYGMKVGESKTVTVPPEKAYGVSGSHPLAGKTLIFKITVVSINA